MSVIVNSTNITTNIETATLSIEELFMVYFLLLIILAASLKRARLLPSLANIAQLHTHSELLDNANQMIATIRIYRYAPFI